MSQGYTAAARPQLFPPSPLPYVRPSVSRTRRTYTSGLPVFLGTATRLLRHRRTEVGKRKQPGGENAANVEDGIIGDVK